MLKLLLELNDFHIAGISDLFAFRSLFFEGLVVGKCGSQFLFRLDEVLRNRSTTGVVINGQFFTLIGSFGKFSNKSVFFGIFFILLYISL